MVTHKSWFKSGRRCDGVFSLCGHSELSEGNAACMKSGAFSAKLEPVPRRRGEGTVAARVVEGV